MAQEQKPVLCLMGPTAAGKTALAVDLHRQLPVEIISADSSLVYRGMDIGTAKPTPAEQARAPHRLIDICDPAEAYSAARFCADVAREIAAVHATGRLPLLVGGTMFYFRAYEFGLSDLPSADPELRRQLEVEGRDRGWPAMHALLVQRDPECARRIEPHDSQRILRALEIVELSGQPVSAVVAARPPKPAPYRFIKAALIPADRTVLHRRIAERLQGMLDRGLLGEVETLRRRGDLNLGYPSLRMVGYRQVWQYLTGEINYIQMTDRAVAATRQLAKRQLTWLRRYPGIVAFDPDHPNTADAVRLFFEQAAAGR